MTEEERRARKRERQRAYYAANRDAIIARQMAARRKLLAEDPEAVRAPRREWQRKNARKLAKKLRDIRKRATPEARARERQRNAARRAEKKESARRYRAELSRAFMLWKLGHPGVAARMEDILPELMALRRQWKSERRRTAEMAAAQLRSWVRGGNNKREVLS